MIEVVYIYWGHEKSYIYILFLFSDSLFIFSHSTTLDSSVFIKYSFESSCILKLNDVKTLNKVVSSAYIISVNMLAPSPIYSNKTGTSKVQ